MTYKAPRVRDSEAIDLILDLPTETLEQILEYLGTDELYSVALLCRRLHYLALPMYLTRCGVTLSSTALELDDDTVQAIPGLRIAGFLHSVKRLSYRFGRRGPDTWIKIEGLIRLVSKLSSVEIVQLEFAEVHDTWASDPKERNEKVESGASAVERLLDLVLNKSCEDLTIDDRSFLVFCLPGSTPNRNLRISPHTPFPKPNLLKSFKIHGCMLRNPRLRDWSINTLNSSLVSTLFIENLEPPELWIAFVPHVNLPNLTELSIGVVIYTQPEFLHFLYRHPRITTLTITDASSEQLRPLPRLFPNFLLPDLTSLTAPLACIAQFLRIADVLPSLRHVTVSVSGDIEGFGRVPPTVAHRLKSVNLSLVLAATYTWRPDGLPRMGDISVLRYIKSMEVLLPPSLEVGISGLLIRLRELRALEYLIFSHRPSEIEASEFEPFMQSICAACPALKMIDIGGDVYDCVDNGALPSLR